MDVTFYSRSHRSFEPDTSRKLCREIRLEGPNIAQNSLSRPNKLQLLRAGSTCEISRIVRENPRITRTYIRRRISLAPPFLAPSAFRSLLVLRALGFSQFSEAFEVSDPVRAHPPPPSIERKSDGSSSSQERFALTAFGFEFPDELFKRICLAREIFIYPSEESRWFWSGRGVATWLHFFPIKTIQK